jgi:hypothetical protein
VLILLVLWVEAKSAGLKSGVTFEILEGLPVGAEAVVVVEMDGVGFAV